MIEHERCDCEDYDALRAGATIPQRAAAREKGSDMMKAWHFVDADRTLLDGNTVAPGYVYSVEGPLKLCDWGLHASVRPIDAIEYAPGPVVCRVEMSGQIIEDTDKLVATQREVLWMADATRTLHEFACWCVRNTPLGDGRVVWDLLSDDHRKAVEAKEAWLCGEATDTDWGDARPASAAVWAAAWTSSRAVRAAAMVIAWTAARPAASAAVWADRPDWAVWAAVWAAERAADLADDPDAARAAQNDKLTAMITALEGE